MFCRRIKISIQNKWRNTVWTWYRNDNLTDTCNIFNTVYRKIRNNLNRDDIDLSIEIKRF